MQNSFLRLSINLRNNNFVGAHSSVRMTKIGKFVRIGNYCNVSGSTIGDYTYIGDNSKLVQVRIGKFDSIASDVKLAAGNHPVSYVSMSPVTYDSKLILNTEKRYEEEFFYADSEKHFLCDIGNDVWIATGAVLVCGKQAIHIGDGAVIAAGAVVTKNVSPYEIWAGVPAHCISKRFDDKTIAALLEVKWREKDEMWIRENIPLFDAPDKLISKIQGEHI